MQIIIKTKNLSSPASIEDLVKKRMASVIKMSSAFKESSELLVELERVTRHHRKGDVFSAEAMINLPGKNLVAKAHGEDLKKLIVEVREELEREIRKYKTKTVDLPRRKYRKIKKYVNFH